MTGKLDHGAFSAWIDTLRVEESGAARQVRLADDNFLRPGLEAIVIGLSNVEAVGLSSPAMVQEIFSHAAEIAAGPRQDRLSGFIRGQVEYFGNILRALNGRGLDGIFASFVSQSPAAEIAPAFRACLKEFIVQAEGALRAGGYLDSPAHSPLARAVVVNGFYRTGSTKVFLAAMGILRAVRRPYMPAAADLTQVDEILEGIAGGAHRGKWVLIKTHYWMPLQNRANVITLFTRRNLADVAASSVRRGIASGKRGQDGMLVAPAPTGMTDVISMLRQQQFINRYVAPRYDMTIIDYEEYYGHDEALVARISGLMEIALSDAEAAEAVEFMAVERARDISAAIPAGARSDPETFININHVSETLGRPGAGLHRLPQDVIDDLKRFGNWPPDAGL